MFLSTNGILITIIMTILSIEHCRIISHYIFNIMKATVYYCLIVNHLKPSFNECMFIKIRLSNLLTQTQSSCMIDSTTSSAWWRVCHGVSMSSTTLPLHSLEPLEEGSTIRSHSYNKRYQKHGLITHELFHFLYYYL